YGVYGLGKGWEGLEHYKGKGIVCKNELMSMKGMMKCEKCGAQGDDELFVIVTGYLPFDYTNLAVLYEKVCIRIKVVFLELHVVKSIYIRTIEWFKQDYTPAMYKEEEEDLLIDDEVLSLHEIPMDSDMDPHWNVIMLGSFKGEYDIGEEGEWTGVVLDIRETL
ncbi:hypothetical protein Tco_1338987, partial [Tanacetum coccineum]